MSYWLGGGPVKRCSHGAMYHECTVVGCEFFWSEELQAKQNLQELAEADFDKAFALLPKALQDKWDARCADLQCDGYSNVEFTSEECETLRNAGIEPREYFSE